MDEGLRTTHLVDLDGEEERRPGYMNPPAFTSCRLVNYLKLILPCDARCIGSIEAMGVGVVCDMWDEGFRPHSTMLHVGEECEVG